MDQVQEIKNYSPDILKSKRVFEATDEKTGEKFKMVECYSISKEKLDSTGYFIKHFYAKYDKVADIPVDSAISVRYSKTWKKFYVV